MASSTGYMYHAEPYCGAATKLPTSGCRQGYDEVIGLAELCAVGKGDYVYFDNLFTSLTLLDANAESEIGGCGSLRENRTERANLTVKKSFQKKRRGASESCSDGHNFVVLGMTISPLQSP